MRILLLSLLLAISSCAFNVSQNGNTTKTVASEGGKSENLVVATLWAQKSAEYDALCHQAYNIATERIETALKKHKKGSKKLAIILDIDETVLNNTLFQGTVIKEGVTFDQALWTEWVKMEKAVPLAGAKEFLTFADKKGVEIFYVSNRDVGAELEATYNNLKKVGIPVKKENMLFKEGKSSKEPRRQKVAEKYDVALLFGDNLIDFTEGFEGFEGDKRKTNVETRRTDWGSRFIVLPNPMYGDWLKPLNKEKKPLRELVTPMK